MMILGGRTGAAGVVAHQRETPGEIPGRWMISGNPKVYEYINRVDHSDAK